MLGAICEGDQLVGAIVFEPQTLSGVLEVFCDPDHAGDLATQKIQRNGSHVGNAFDQKCERGAKHHSTEQW